jgi:hypothetical protein
MCVENKVKSRFVPALLVTGCYQKDRSNKVATGRAPKRSGINEIHRIINDSKVKGSR